MTMVNAMNRSLSFFRPLKAVVVDTQSQMVHYYQLYYYHFSLCFLPDVWQETQSEKAQLPYIWSWRLNWMSLLSQTWWWRTLAPMLSSHARLITKMDRTMTAKVRRIIWLRAILLLNWGYSESTIPKLLLLRTFFNKAQKEIDMSRLSLFNVRAYYSGLDIEKIVDLWTFFNIEKEILENSDMTQSQSLLTSIFLLMNGLSLYLTTLFSELFFCVWNIEQSHDTVVHTFLFNSWKTAFSLLHG